MEFKNNQKRFFKKIKIKMQQALKKVYCKKTNLAISMSLNLLGDKFIVTTIFLLVRNYFVKQKKKR